ncbi:hypothetical protein WJX72_009652 [[Myrmecia] bisecta]|uniref:HNH nuclease domain-containing protein n=1 Tax=[Myrmecia] bisecta TaxID=41462 RepID=A0AAW1R983_9CHLO
MASILEQVAADLRDVEEDLLATQNPEEKRKLRAERRKLRAELRGPLMPERVRVLEQKVATLEKGVRLSRSLFISVFKMQPSTSVSSEKGDPQSGTNQRKSKRKADKQAFRENLFDAHNVSLAMGYVRVQLPDVEVPSAHACAAHIFPRRCTAHMPGWLDMTDIDDVKNGLVILKPLQPSSMPRRKAGLRVAASSCRSLHRRAIHWRRCGSFGTPGRRILRRRILRRRIPRTRREFLANALLHQIFGFEPAARAAG